MKKFISICVTVMCLLFCINCVFAESNMSDKQAEAVSLMNDLKIYEGISEENAEETVTRAEFAKIIVRVMGAEDLLTANPQRIFADVLPENGAAASIEYLYQRGIMLGYGQAEFKPDSVISLNEAVKVLIIVTGYSERAEYQGGYPIGYFSTAAANSIIKGVSGEADSEVTYADAAVMIQNVLENDNYLVMNGYQYGNPVLGGNDGENYMGYVLNVYSYTGIVEACGDTSLYSSADTYREDIVKVGGELFAAGELDFSEYIGRRVKVYYKADNSGSTAIHMVPDKNSEMIEALPEDIDEDTTVSNFRYYDGSRTKSIKIADDAVFIYNGKRLDVVTDMDLKVDNGWVRLISNDGGGKYDVVIIKEYETFIVDKTLAADSIVNLKYDRGSLELSGESNIKPVFYLDGAETDFSSIGSGSVLSIALSKNTDGDMLAEVLISNNSIDGIANRVYSNSGEKYVILVDGSEYQFTREYISRIEAGERNTYEPELGNEGTYYIDYFGRLAGYALKVEAKNYAYVVKCFYDPNEDEGLIRLFTKDGEFENFQLSKKVNFNGSSISKEEVPEALVQASYGGTINQLIIAKTSEDGYIKTIQTALNKTAEPYYIASGNQLVLNSNPKNSSGVQCGLRFYKNMAVDKPFNFVDGKTIQFMIPTDKANEREYKVATKLSSTDVSLPAPLFLYDAGEGGALGAVVSNTASTGKYVTPCIVESLEYGINDDGDYGTMINFVGGQTLFVDEYVTYSQPGNNWNSQVDYSNVKVENLKRGDVITYTTSNNKADDIRVIVRVDDIGPIRTDGVSIAESGNMIAEVVSVSENGRTALVHYFDNDKNSEFYQSMLINSTTYRYDSRDGKVYSSSASDLEMGDKILINSFWWSPKLVVIFR